MRISVFGLGYVGVVSAACLADAGHEVIGVDALPAKVDLVAAGRATVVEDGVDELVARVVADGRLRATTDAAAAVAATDLAFVCVGTPSSPTGALDTQALVGVTDEIGAALPRDRRFVVVVRSTMLPGTLLGTVRPRLERASGLRVPEQAGLCAHPEFLREGSSLADFHDPPKTVVGSLDPADADTVIGLYGDRTGPVFSVAPAVAELTKYVDNSWHATKVAFANEIGSLARVSGVDSAELMDVFVADTKLNLSDSYLRPGGPFGGSCLPKDVRAITHAAGRADLDLPLLESLLASNDRHLDRAIRLVEAAGHRSVGLFGLAFKSGTDDLRESPQVRLAEHLLGRGYDLRIHDDLVNAARLVGANRAYVEQHLPHLARLLVSRPADVVAHADTVVVAGQADVAVAAVSERAPKAVVDLVGRPELAHVVADYRGLCW